MADGDHLSGVLDLLGARAAVAGGFVAGGAWAIRFPAPDRVKFFIASRGECRVHIDGMEGPVTLRRGDVFLLTAARPFELSAGGPVAALDAREVYADGTRALQRLNAGDDFHFLGCHVRFESLHAPLFVESLPPFLHLAADADEAKPLAWMIAQLVDEYATERQGSAFATTQLAQLMFMHIVRAHLARASTDDVGRLRLLADARVSPALVRMHAEPGRQWEVEELARLAGMSRTTFAVYFKSIAGVGPLQYLTDWRMRIAERELGRATATFAELASSLGYSSESAFSNAFKRVTGLSPAHYRTKVRRERGQPGRT